MSQYPDECTCGLCFASMLMVNAASVTVFFSMAVFMFLSVLCVLAKTVMPYLVWRNVTSRISFSMGPMLALSNRSVHHAGAVVCPTGVTKATCSWSTEAGAGTGPSRPGCMRGAACIRTPGWSAGTGNGHPLGCQWALQWHHNEVQLTWGSTCTCSNKCGLGRGRSRGPGLGNGGSPVQFSGFPSGLSLQGHDCPSFQGGVSSKIEVSSVYRDQVALFNAVSPEHNTSRA